MNALHKPLVALTAEDLMSPAVVTIPEDMFLSAAAERLAESGLRGAPVVDATGHCVGVISTTDFLYPAMAKTASAPGDLDDVYFAPWRITDPTEMRRDSVRRYMNTPPSTVAPSTPIAVLARMMVDRHIRRLIVVEQEGKLIGVVSATDLLRALAERADEESATATN